MNLEFAIIAQIPMVLKLKIYSQNTFNLIEITT